jgi:Bacterial SH3 domain
MRLRNHCGMRTVWPLCLLFYAIPMFVLAQADSRGSIHYERSFPQSKAVVEKRIKEIQSCAGRLPVFDGFTVPGDRALNRFQRGYYQCVTQVRSTLSGGSTVLVRATITAWYNDPVAGKSDYQVLPSNGRLENDFLDRLQDGLGAEASSVANSRASSMLAPISKIKPGATEPTISAPALGDPAPIAKSGTAAGSAFSLGDPLGSAHMASLATRQAIVDKHTEEQEKEAKALEEILQNQAHPSNLVAVTSAKTLVFASPSQGAKVLFQAAAEDEFEILDSNPNWVHVRISGLSRGWIRRSNLEMPEAESEAQPVESGKKFETEKGTGTHSPPAAHHQPFQVQSEQIASFPGTWAPLRGKTVNIISVQKIGDNATDAGSAAKLAFAKSLFDKAYVEVAKGSTGIDGVVVIFDSDDGGMTAATVAVLRQWKTGTLSEEAFWRRCFFDPPEAFHPTSNP